jgi:hypothetical protein
LEEKPVEQLPKQEEIVPENLTPAVRESLEHGIRKLQLAKKRGDVNLIASILKELHEVAPGSSLVTEIEGDDLIERGQRALARLKYDRARKLDPKNISADRKFAETVFAMDASQITALTGNMSDLERVAIAKAHLTQSFLLPGLGQIFKGEMQRGLFMMGGYIIALFWLLLIPNGLVGLLDLFGMSQKTHAAFNGIVFIPLFLMAVFWIWSIADASTEVKKLGKVKITVPEKPFPTDF